MANYQSDPLEIAIYKAFNDFVTASLEEVESTCFLEDSGFNAPSDGYSVIKIIQATPTTWTRSALVTPTDTTGLEESYTLYEGIVKVSFYGNLSFSKAQVVSSCLRHKQLKQLLRDNGIAYINHTPVRDASRGVDRTKIEKGSTFSINFYFVQGGRDKGDDAGVIEEATVRDNDQLNYTNWPPTSP